MSTFHVKCPSCGILLDADEKYIGLVVSCEKCDAHFPLWKTEDALPPYPDMLERYKVGIVAKAGVQLSIISGLFGDEQLELTLSPEECKRIFHFSYPLFRNENESAHLNGYNRYWKNPVSINGISYLVCKEWFESNRKYLIFWLRQMNVAYGDLSAACDLLQNGPADKKADLPEKHEPTVPAGSDVRTFTFDDFPKNLDYSQPLFLTMPNGTFPVKYWSEVLVRCYDYAYQNNRDKVESLADIEAPPPLRKGILFARDPQVLRTARELSPGFYMEVNFSAHSIVKNVCGLMAYCGFPVKAFSVTYRVKSSGPPAPESKVDAPVSSSEFSKPLDFSTFTTGITIPVRVHEAFLKHLSVKLERGKSHPVTIMVGDSSFQVSINNIGFSEPNRKQVLMFLWRKHSPLARSFQATFPAVFEQLSEDHANRTGIDTVLTVSCAEQPDVFKIAMDTPLLENKKPVAPVQAETVAPISLEASVSEVAPFITVLLRDFSAGFEFNDSSVRLLESAVGRPCPESVQKELKRRMFRRYDGIYLLPEMVADGETLGAIKHRIEEYFDQFHAFSLPVLYGEFEGALHALTNPDSDFRLFLLGAILPEFPEGGKVFGKLQKQIGIPGSLEEQDVLDFLAERIREILLQGGDAVLNEDLLAELPCLNIDALEMIIREQIPEAVEILVDELRYWKLLEFFCLPEELGDDLLQIIAAIEQQNKTPSLRMIADRLAELFGDDFRETYALEEDDVLRQVIIKSIHEEKYGWKGNLLVRNGSGHGINVADEFLQGHHGIFHEEEFFGYAASHRGLTNTPTLVCRNLRISCIRLGQHHWIGLADFEQQSDFSVEMVQKLTQELQSRLANRLFLPLGTLPDAFFSELPPLHIQEHVFYWNAYMLASIAEHKLSGVHAVNTEPSPYIVTAMLIPENSDYRGDVIDFVFRALRGAKRQFSTADQVFEYLEQHQVRMRKTSTLLERIRAFWGVN